MDKYEIKTEILNLLFFSRDTTVGNVSEECYIQGFIGNYGKDMENISNIFPRLLEMFCLNVEGTTIGYEEVEGKVVPRTEYVNYLGWQVRAMEALQRGVVSFQKEFLELAEKKPHIRKWDKYNIELCNLLERLFDYPLKKEAECLGKIQYDQNFGVNSFSPVIYKKFIEESKKDGLKKFYGKIHTSEIQWFSGLNAIVEPAGYYEILLKSSRKYMFYTLILICEYAIKLADNKKIIIVGAGKNTVIILKFLSAIGRMNSVEVIIDNNVDLWCSTMAGINVGKVDKEYDSNIYLCSTSNKVFRDALLKQIKNYRKDDFKFISCFREDDII